MDKLEVKVARLDGRMLELLYQQKAPSYFGRWLRRVKVLDANDVLDAVEERLSESQIQELLLADLFVRGRARQRPDGPPIWLGGSFQGEPRWSYPSPWPGLHASHEAAVPDRPGMVVGHTRLLGDRIRTLQECRLSLRESTPFRGAKGDNPIGPMFCSNGNMGNMYLITADGLFVATLFHDIRLKPNWAAPVATRNMDVTDVSLHDENFWPSITPTAGCSWSTAAARVWCASMDSTRCSVCPSSL
jgi:hypothetical protein